MNTQLPPRLVITLADLRMRAIRLSDNVERAGQRIEPLWHHAMPWITGIAVALAYLLAQAWVDAADLRSSLEIANRVHRDAALENQALRFRIAELAATRNVELFWLLEGDIEQARAKLNRAGLLISQQHYELMNSREAK